ncbi:MAG: orotidine-5'-phosphate decarboxylase [Bdellovibrionales bacterium]
MTKKPTIFVALDTTDLAQAALWAKTTGPITGGLKVGMEFVNTHGPQGIEVLQKACPDAKLFIDLKFHDIPNTVAGAVRTTCSRFTPAYLNVHAAGGETMMKAAKDACDSQTKLLAVTILTSLSQEEINAVGYTDQTTPDIVKRMALLTQKCGLDGVVCSSKEIELIREACEDTFETMVPGIRPIGSDSGDQKRIMTPIQATSLGATNLVIGRPITGADDPQKAAEEIVESLTKIT